MERTTTIAGFFDGSLWISCLFLSLSTGTACFKTALITTTERQ